MEKQSRISEQSSRVAKNTLMLSFRMLLLLFIGMFTSRVVLKELGIEDYGTYDVVYSTVMMFTVLSNGISTSISRFMAYEVGTGDKQQLKKVFGCAVTILIACCILLFILAETLGLWYLREKIIIPPGRMDAAVWVFQASVILLAIQLLSIPFNSLIVAHEDMKAFAWISLLEGTLKLGTAAYLTLTTYDKLKVYAVLMASVAFIIRMTYASFCRKHYDESKSGLCTDTQLMRSMLSMGVWSFTAHGVGVFNTQGINLLINRAFGVSINAVKKVAGVIESIVRQFINSFTTALNPLITKTWASGDKKYCYALVRKGCKFSFLIGLMIAVPFSFEADFILDLWLETVPDKAGLFASLAVICVIADFMSNSLAQLMIANGKVGLYYSVTSLISSLNFAGCFVAFKAGAPAEISYCIAITVLVVISVARLFFAKACCGFPLIPFIREVAVPSLLTAALSTGITWIPYHFIQTNSIIKALICILTGGVSVFVLAWLIALTKGEREYCLDYVRKFFPGISEIVDRKNRT